VSSCIGLKRSDPILEGKVGLKTDQMSADKREMSAHSARIAALSKKQKKRKSQSYQNHTQSNFRKEEGNGIKGQQSISYKNAAKGGGLGEQGQEEEN